MTRQRPCPSPRPTPTHEPDPEQARRTRLTRRRKSALRWSAATPRRASPRWWRRRTSPRSSSEPRAASSRGSTRRAALVRVTNPNPDPNPNPNPAGARERARHRGAGGAVALVQLRLRSRAAANGRGARGGGDAQDHRPCAQRRRWLHGPTRTIRDGRGLQRQERSGRGGGSSIIAYCTGTVYNFILWCPMLSFLYCKLPHDHAPRQAQGGWASGVRRAGARGGLPSVHTPYRVPLPACRTPRAHGAGSHYHSSRGVPLTESSSTSKTRVASPGIVGGAPRLP